MKRNNTILVLLLPPPFGGGEILCEYIYNEFKNNSNYTSVIIRRKTGSKKSQGRVTIQNMLYSVFTTLRVIFRMIRCFPIKLYIGIPKDFLSFIRTSVIIISARLLGVNVYGELAGTSFRFMEDEMKLRYKYGRYIFGKISSMRLLGENIVNYGKRIGFRHIVVFDNGIDVPVEYRIKDNAIFDEELKMIYMGTLDKLKGIYNIIEGLRLCNENNIKFKFTFVGEWVKNEVRKSISDLIFEYELADYIEFTGLKINEEKWKIFSKSSVLVHPTYWDGQPVSILEAMGLGLGVISTKVGAIPDTIKNEYNGILLQENTPENLYVAIKRFYDDRPFLELISKNNLETYNKRFTGKVFLKNFRCWIESDESVCAE